MERSIAWLNLSTRLIKLIFHVSLSQQRSTTVSLLRNYKSNHCTWLEYPWGFSPVTPLSSLIKKTTHPARSQETLRLTRPILLAVCRTGMVILWKLLSLLSYYQTSFREEDIWNHRSFALTAEASSGLRETRLNTHISLDLVWMRLRHFALNGINY